MVIVNGRDVEVGTHSELLKMKRVYYDLVQVHCNDVYYKLATYILFLSNNFSSLLHLKAMVIMNIKMYQVNSIYIYVL